MYVCICKAVTDREVARAIAGGARTIDDVSRCTGAGTDCGSCREAIAAATRAAAGEQGGQDALSGACPGPLSITQPASERSRLLVLRTLAALASG